MWHDILKSKAHWVALRMIEKNLKNSCETNGLTFASHIDGTTKRLNNNFKPSNIGQYEFLYGILERTLRDMAMGSGALCERDSWQPAPLGEAYRHTVTLDVGDASFYLHFRCRQMEPSIEDKFECEMSFSVPKEFWGDDDKYYKIHLL